MQTELPDLRDRPVMTALANECSRFASPWLLAFRLMLVAAVGGLAVGSLLPSEYLPEHPLRDKTLHFAAYALVSALAMLAVRTPRRQVSCLLLLTLLGIALEFGQTYVPGRAFELWDMAANGCGVWVAFQGSRLLVSWTGCPPLA